MTRLSLSSLPGPIGSVVAKVGTLDELHPRAWGYVLAAGGVLLVLSALPRGRKRTRADQAGVLPTGGLS
jgi:hypothetical protein